MTAPSRCLQSLLCKSLACVVKSGRRDAQQQNEAAACNLMLYLSQSSEFTKDAAKSSGPESSETDLSALA